MQPHHATLRVAAANDILKELGASAILGEHIRDDAVEYFYEDGLQVVFSPLNNPEDSDDA